MESSRGSSSDKPKSRDRRRVVEDHEREIAALREEVAALSRELYGKDPDRRDLEERFQQRLESTARDLETVIAEAREIGQLATRHHEAPQMRHARDEEVSDRVLERVETLVQSLGTELAAVARTLREGDTSVQRGLL